VTERREPQETHAAPGGPRNPPRGRPGSSTAAVHGGALPPRPWPHGLSTPIFRSSTYELDATAYADIARTGGERTWWYSRLGNPTIDAAAARLAALEGAQDALLFASGMAAISATLLSLTPAGGRIVSARELYGDVFTLLRDTLVDAGRSVTFVAISDEEGWERELATGADVLYVETLSNPTLRLADLPALARRGHRAGTLTIVDSTFASPVNCRPIEHGFDLVLHSATKYLNGHSDLVAGAVAGSRELISAIRPLAATLGGCLDPASAAHLERGLKTLVLRMERHNRTGLNIARWLEAHAEVEAVSYPLLESHPDHRLAQRLLHGGSGIVTLRVAGGDTRAASAMDALTLICQATSLGGVESLISAPYNTSHAGLDTEELAAAGILPGTLRLSVGIEDEEDLIADLDHALAATAHPIGDAGR
jgi:cystathionine beta-lyase/cystathionine gamma-synthase